MISWSKLNEFKISDWEIMVSGNPGLAGTDYGYCYFYHGDAEFSDVVPRFASQHVNVIDEKDASRAFTRIKTILRLVSGIRVICGYSAILPLHGYITYNYNESLSNQRIYREITPNDDLDILIEEFQNPFDDSLVPLASELKRKNNKSKIQDYCNLILIDSLVREVIILFTLGEEQAIYFLVNTYKIMENLKVEYNLGINNGKLIKKKDSKPIHDNLFESLNDLYKYSRYINSKDAAGILSRHGAGAGNVEPPQKKDKPTFKEIREVLIKSIDYWLNYKCELVFERSYIYRK